MRGEDHGQAAPAAPVAVELTDDREVPVLDVDPDFSTYDDEQLLELMTQNLGTDDGLYERAAAEYDRSQAVDDESALVEEWLAAGAGVARRPAARAPEDRRKLHRRRRHAGAEKLFRARTPTRSGRTQNIGAGVMNQRSVNCQRAVQALELRDRGYDVVAAPNIEPTPAGPTIA